MVTYGQVIGQLESKLESVGEEKEALTYVFQALKKWSKTHLILSLNQEISVEDQHLLQQIARDLLQHYPPQYIIGSTYFCDLLLKVDERVLIPRPETEELVHLILNENPHQTLKVLDIGTGSGAIALALKKARPNWEVYAADISNEALDLARENAELNQLEITFMQSDVYSRIVTSDFDIIVSNPPYISYKDKEEVDLNVLRSEPHLALFAEENGLAIYRRIISGASEFLKDGGKLYFEIGYQQGDDLTLLVRNYLGSKRVRVLKDMFDQNRMVVVDNG